jgi:GTP-binding protein YchF
MKIGLIGFNQTGKTSLFELLTGKDSSFSHSGGKAALNTGTCFVPDTRIDFLSELFNPKKTTYAQINLVDVPGLSISTPGHNAAARFLGDVRNCDALIHVLRAFESDTVIHDFDSINPVRDMEAVESEMQLADLEMIDKRINRINSGKKITKEHAAELDLLKRCFKRIEDEGSIKNMELSADESLAVRGFSLLTDKPRLIVVNLDENQWATGKYPDKDVLQGSYGGSQLIELCIDIELEISKLPGDDKVLFMEDMNITESGVAKLAKAAYTLMNLISFLTYGSDEVKAWTIENGTIAKVAAGKIHSDIERGFIRAEVIKYNDLSMLGTITKVKEKGLYRLEGKDYIVEDGDLITFRFNV